jgi:hypothetical protein
MFTHLKNCITLFTSQNSIRCVQVNVNSCLFSEAANIGRQEERICSTVSVGTRTVIHAAPVCTGSVTETGQYGERELTQIFCNMKDARKQTIASAPNPNAHQSASRALEEDIFLHDAVFSKAPAPRIPESPEEEHFRSFLKHQLPRYKASHSLSQKIKGSLLLQDHKKA